MSFWSAFPFARLTLAWIGGILIAYYNLCNNLVAIFSLLLMLLIYLILILRLSRSAYYQGNGLIGFIGLSCISLLGYFCLWSHRADYNPEHMLHQQDSIAAYVAVVQEPIQDQESYVCVTIGLKKAFIKTRWQAIKGKVQLYIHKPFHESLVYGDVVVILGQPETIKKPLNPQEFNLKSYLGYQHIYYRQVIHPSNLTKITYAPASKLQALLLQLRQDAQAILSHPIHHPREKGIVLALVLGAKSELDELLKTAYIMVGTMHVLAVSGLHVGILYWVLSILLNWLGNGRLSGWIQLMLILSGLWLYACITGLAASVLRSTVMFTLMAIANWLGRGNHIYNVLAASAFILLFFDPYLIFAVGFQLSYLAVLGIIYLQPKIYSLLKFHHRLLRQLWLASSISLAAQLSTTLLSCYYFHQFPTYFLVANWVVVPAAFVILTLGLGVLATGWWQGLQSYIAWLLEYITWLVNEFVLWMSTLPCGLIGPIYLHKISLALGYGFLGCLLLFLQRKKFLDLVSASLLALMLGIVSIKNLRIQQREKGLIFYSIKPYTVLAFMKGIHSWFLVNEQVPDFDQKYKHHIQPSQLAMGKTKAACYTYADTLASAQLPWRIWQGLKIGVWDKKRWIIIDKASVPYFASLPKMTTDFLIIEQNALYDLRPLLTKFEFHTLIIGCSNSKKRASKLKVEANLLKLNHHSLHEDGAFTYFWYE